MPAPTRRYPTVPLSADPDFLLAQRSWTRFAQAVTGLRLTAQIEVDLESPDWKTRDDAQREVSKHLANMLIMAAAWSTANPEADADNEIGSALLPAINWLVRALKIPTSMAPMVQSEVEMIDGEEGQRLSEGVPPCWSPRWSEQRKLQRLVSPARLAAGEFYSYFLELIPRIQDKLPAGGNRSDVSRVIGALTRRPVLARAGLAEIKNALTLAERKVGGLVHREQVRAELKDARSEVKKLEARLAARKAQAEEELLMSIPAFIERQFARLAKSESESRTETSEILTKYAGYREQTQKAWDLLNARRRPREPKAQYEALEELMDEGTKKGSSK